jgi:hypothetical protein
VAPHFGEASINGLMPCAFWPVPPTGRPRTMTAHGAPSILVVGGTGDPATPYSWAKALASQLERAVLLTRTGEGHVSYDKSDCVRAAVDKYLLEIILPAPNTVCSS